jgi:hypothetical protein
MKNIQLFLITLLLSILTTFSFAQNNLKVYILNFPTYDIEDIKPLVFLTQPLFEDAQIEIQNDNYKKFIYKSKLEVSEEDIKKALEGTKFKLISLEINE